MPLSCKAAFLIGFMQKIFIIIPDKTPYSLCAKSFAKGFKHAGFYMEKSFSSEVDKENLLNFNPDIVMCFDFAELTEGILDEIYQKNQNCIFIFDFITAINKNSQKIDIANLKYFEGKKLIFTADKSNLKSIENSIYLPSGINTKKYKSVFEKYNRGISIFANPDDINNLKIITDLIEHFGKISVFADEFEYLHSLENELWEELDNPDLKEAYRKSYCGSVAEEKERAKAMSTSFITVIPSSHTPNGVDFTVFETIASSGFAICEENPETKRLFDVGREIETYKYTSELIDKIEFYLAHPSFARTIADNARMAAVNNHSIQITIRKISDIIKKKFK